jgi:hypothetical protein
MCAPQRATEPAETTVVPPTEMTMKMSMMKMSVMKKKMMKGQ